MYVIKELLTDTHENIFFINIVSDLVWIFVNLFILIIRKGCYCSLGNCYILRSLSLMFNLVIYVHAVNMLAGWCLLAVLFQGSNLFLHM